MKPDLLQRERKKSGEILAAAAAAFASAVSSSASARAQQDLFPALVPKKPKNNKNKKKKRTSPLAQAQPLVRGQKGLLRLGRRELFERRAELAVLAVALLHEAGHDEVGGGPNERQSAPKGHGVGHLERGKKVGGD